VAVSARVATLAGQPVAARTLAVELFRYDPNTYAFTTLVRAASMTTDANGNAGTTLAAEADRYQIRITGYDARWKMTRVYREINVVGAAMEAAGLLITADRDAYHIGDTAGLTIASAVGGPAWLTVERGTVRRTQLITLSAPLTRVALPIEAGDAPNIFVSVFAWTARNDLLSPNTYFSLRERALRTATVTLQIEQPEKALTVAIIPNAESYSPGDHATFIVRVTNARGEPVSAEVALALVSEAAASWAEPLAAPIFGAFHHTRGHTVSGSDSFAPLRDLFGWGGGCGGCGGDWYDGGLQSELSGLATVGWAPSLRTDWNGEATVTLPLPNRVAEWRATAIAATTDTQVGEGSVVIEVK
jgi:hypothetical protein